MTDQRRENAKTKGEHNLLQKKPARWFDTLHWLRDSAYMDTPIYNMLRKYAGQKPLPFHMPGHVMGRGLAGFFKCAGRMDITEIPGSDSLHDPDGVIKEAQALAARAFGAKNTYFSVNGSTAGIHAMIRAAVRPGGKIIINRDAHTSVINAISLLGAEPVCLLPKYDEENHIALGCKAGDVKDALSGHPDAQAVLITRPNYYGVATDMKEMAEAARSRGIPFMVDEAHGAHYAFSRLFPKPALRLGADACVQSLHKTLPAMTQTALVHESPSSLLGEGRLFRYMSMIQTTSPSYVLMASIDIARELMEKRGADLYDALYRRIRDFDRELLGIPGVKRVVPEGPGVENDFSRIVLSFEQCGFTGFEAERLLREWFGIVAEMADYYHVVLIATPFHADEDFVALIDAIRSVTRQGSGKFAARLSFVRAPESLPERAMSPGAASQMPYEYVPLEKAGGRISASTITPYPPGIPLVYPGEVISPELVRYLAEIRGSGGRIHGIMDGKVQAITPIK